MILIKNIDVEHLDGNISEVLDSFIDETHDLCIRDPFEDGCRLPDNLSLKKEFIQAEVIHTPRAGGEVIYCLGMTQRVKDALSAYFEINENLLARETTLREKVKTLNEEVEQCRKQTALAEDRVNGYALAPFYRRLKYLLTGEM